MVPEHLTRRVTRKSHHIVVEQSLVRILKHTLAQRNISDPSSRPQRSNIGLSPLLHPPGFDKSLHQLNHQQLPNPSYPNLPTQRPSTSQHACPSPLPEYVGRSMSPNTRHTPQPHHNLGHCNLTSLSGPSNNFLDIPSCQWIALLPTRP